MTLIVLELSYTIFQVQDKHTEKVRAILNNEMIWDC